MGFDVLIVDDEEMYCDVIATYLRHAGYRVQTATDGAVACDIVEKEQPQPGWVLLTDIDMPRMDGLALITKAIQDSWTCRTIIVSSASDPMLDHRPNKIASALGEWSRSFKMLPKPFDGRELLNMIKTTVSPGRPQAT
jgi:CheY-like chemotaxis protein